MVEMYTGGQSTKQIGKQLGFSTETVRRRLIEAGVDIAPKGKGRSQANLEPPKNRRGPLSQEEVDRLRRLVGFHLDQE